MKVLLCHNYYREPGGEDQVFEDEARLLESGGCEVVRFERHSRQAETMSRWQIFRRAMWSSETYGELSALIRRERPEVMHCTNLFPLISPAAYDAAADHGVPVVQSLHNFRSVCANSLLMRNGTACEKCLQKRVPWPAVVHGCYRGSRLASAVLAGSIGWQGVRRQQHDPVAVRIALSEFSRERFVRAGFPAERLVVKPNFVDPDPGVGPGFGGYALFVGRLSAEKGLDVLVQAWRQLPVPIGLKIIGDGPLASTAAQAAELDPRIEWLGRQPNSAILDLLGHADLLILPSVCYENCPKVILEAYSKGTPVIASKLGAMAEYVRDKQTGLTFAAGQASELADRVAGLIDDPSELMEMRSEARAEYEARYTAQANYHMLMKIYARALGKTVTDAAPEAITELPVLSSLESAFPAAPISAESAGATQ